MVNRIDNVNKHVLGSQEMNDQLKKEREFVDDDVRFCASETIVTQLNVQSNVRIYCISVTLANYPFCLHHFYSS